MDEDTQRALEILQKSKETVPQQEKSQSQHNLLDMMAEMVIVDEDTLPLPKEVLDKGIAREYLAKCQKYMQTHDPQDFKMYWGISPEDYPQLYNDAIYSIARLCYFLTDCYQVKSWGTCWNHEGETGGNFIVSIDGVARKCYNSLYHQLKREIPEKRTDSECSICKKRAEEKSEEN